MLKEVSEERLFNIFKVLKADSDFTKSNIPIQFSQNKIHDFLRVFCLCKAFLV